MKGLYSLLGAVAMCAAWADCSVTVSRVSMPTYPYGDPDPVPAAKPDRVPYFRYDGQSAASRLQAWTEVKLSNGLVEVRLLPEIGGKVWGARDLKTGRDFIYANDAVKFRDIAMRGPWCSGGIEFNFGLTGHAQWTASPVDWTVRTNADSSVSYFCGGLECVTRTYWQVEVNLRPAERFFTTRMLWHNSGGMPMSRYQWSTSAVSARGNPVMRYPGAHQIDHDGTAYAWPVDAAGVDRSIYANDNDIEAVSWHVIDGDNRFLGIWYPEAKFGMWHRNAEEDKFGRKIFMWSQARSGGIWEDLLTDRAGQYIELQSGRGMQQQVKGCWKTPFRFQTLVPGATDVFEEQWGATDDYGIYAEAMKLPAESIGRPVEFPKDHDPETAYELYRAGEQTLRAGLDLAAGADLLEKALAKEPCLVPALGELAAFRLRSGDVSEALRLSDKALALDAYDPQANFVSGEIALDCGEIARARERFGVSALDAAWRPAALVRLGQLALREGDRARVGELARKILDCSPADPEGHQLAVMAGCESVEEALRVAPLHPALNHLAGRRFGRGAGELGGELPEQSALELGLWHMRAGLHAEARSIFAEAKGRDGKPHAIALLLAGRAEEAASAATDFVFPYRRETIAALQEAVRTHGSWKFKYYLAIAYAALGRRIEADRLLEACGDAPDAAAFYLMRAPRRSGDASVADVRKAARLADSWRTGCALVEALLRKGDTPAACAAAADYRARFPDCQQLDTVYVRALIAASRAAEAVKVLSSMKVLPSEFNKAVPNLWNTCHLELAKTALAKGDREVARQHVEAALSFPENLGAGRPVRPETAIKDWPDELKALHADPERPYEMTRAARMHDEFPPVARLENAVGWGLVRADAEAELSSAADRALFGSGVLRLKYRAKGERPVVRLVPARPVDVPRDADTVSLWVYGNNICGSASYTGGRKVPITHLYAEFALGDEKGRVDLGVVRHLEWFLQFNVMDEKVRNLVARGAKLTALVLEDGTNADFETLDFTSLCVFRDPQRPLAVDGELAKRLGEPPKEFPSIAPEDAASGELEFRFPKNSSGPWDDMAVRVKGGAWVPFAIGGGIFPESARSGAKVTFSRVGDSVVVDVCSAAPGIEEVRFGAASLPSAFQEIGLPYYTYTEIAGAVYRPRVVATRVDGKPLFMLASMNWYASNASHPLVKRRAAEGLAESNAGVAYLPDTAGVRKPVREQFVWSFSSDAQKVLPRIPNAPSPYRKFVGSRVRIPRGCGAKGDRDEDKAFFRKLHDAGMTKLLVTDHEILWRDGNESFTFRTETAPKKGGDAAANEFARFMIDELGLVYGPYNNYTDFAPVNRHWSLDAVTRATNGAPVHAWNRCYAPKPVWSAVMNRILAPRIQEKFRYACAYCDVHTCIAPWERVDYDWRAPGAATFGATYRSYCDILETQRKVWNGPVASEGGIQFMYAGICDSSYAQDSHYGLSVSPWIVDFDLLRMHPLSCDTGAGLIEQFYCWWRTQDETDPDTPAYTRTSRFIAATLAFGHAGCLGGDFDSMRRCYFLTRGIASEYAEASAVEIRYGDEKDRLLPTGEALLSGAYRRSQVRVTYDNGVVVAVNGSRTDDFSVEVHGKSYVLPPNGWYASTRDGKVFTSALIENGRRVERSGGPDGDFVCEEPSVTF